MTDYEELTTKYKNLQIELNSLDVLEDLIDKRRKQVKEIMEKNLDLQEMFWPDPNKQIIEQTDLVADYIAHPDLSLEKLGARHNVTMYKASQMISEGLNFETYRKKGWAFC